MSCFFSTLLNAFRFEEAGAVVSIANSSGNFGDQVELALSGSNLAGLCAADITISFDPTVLSAQSARVGSLTAGWTLAANLGTAGRVVLSLADLSAVSGSGSLALIRFNVLRAPPATTSLVIESMSLNDGALTGTRSDGLFSVNSFFDLSGAVRYFKDGTAVPGVAVFLDGVGSFSATSNSGGSFALTHIPSGSYLLTPAKADSVNGITALDASLVLQKAAGLLSLSAEETRAADVNRNSAISAMDASYILKAAVGLIQVPFPGAGKVWDFLPEERLYSPFNSNLSGQDFTAVLLGDVSGNWSTAGAQAPGLVQAGTAAFALVHDAINVSGPNAAVLLVKTLQPAIHGLDLTVSFDPALTLDQVLTEPLGRNHALAFHCPVAGCARIAAASALPVTGEGVLLELRFSGPPANLAVTNIQMDESRVAAVADPALDVFDLDHDGLINTLETGVYHTNPAVADSDGDGCNDGAEVIAGTSPNDPAACLAVTAIEHLPGGLLRLTWHSVPGRIYTVELAESLENAAWAAATSAITAEGALTTATVVRPAMAKRAFYRVAVSSGY